MFKILGSADILGSPVSFISNMGTGVYDFFHEPALGLVSSPQDFGRGIKKVLIVLMHTHTDRHTQSPHSH